MNSPYEYGRHKFREVQEHINQELDEMGYSEADADEYWEGFIAGLEQS